jgi:hypothetical protein
LKAVIAGPSPKRIPTDRRLENLLCAELELVCYRSSLA